MIKSKGACSADEASSISVLSWHVFDSTSLLARRARQRLQSDGRVLYRRGLVLGYVKVVQCFISLLALASLERCIASTTEFPVA